MAYQQAYGAAGFMDNPLYEAENPTDQRYLQRLREQANAFQMSPEMLNRLRQQKQQEMDDLRSRMWNYRENLQAKSGMSLDPYQSSSMASIMPDIMREAGNVSNQWDANILAQQQAAAVAAANMMAGGYGNTYGQQYQRYFNPVGVDRGGDQQRDSGMDYMGLGAMMYYANPYLGMAANLLKPKKSNNPYVAAQNQFAQYT